MAVKITDTKLYNQLSELCREDAKEYALRFFDKSIKNKIEKILETPSDERYKKLLELFILMDEVELKIIDLVDSSR